MDPWNEENVDGRCPRAAAHRLLLQLDLEMSGACGILYIYNMILDQDDVPPRAATTHVFFFFVCLQADLVLVTLLCFTECRRFWGGFLFKKQGRDGKF